MGAFENWKSERGNSGSLISLPVYNQLHNQPRLLTVLLESAGFRPYWEASESALKLQGGQVRLNESLAQLNASQLEKVIMLFDVPRKILPGPESATGTIGEAMVQVAVQEGREGDRGAQASSPVDPATGLREYRATDPGGPI